MKVVKRTLTRLSSYRRHGSKITADLNGSPTKLMNSKVSLDQSESVRLDCDIENDQFKS